MQRIKPLSFGNIESHQKNNKTWYDKEDLQEIHRKILEYLNKIYFPVPVVEPVVTVIVWLLIYSQASIFLPSGVVQ